MDEHDHPGEQHELQCRMQCTRGEHRGYCKPRLGIGDRQQEASGEGGCGGGVGSCVERWRGGDAICEIQDVQGGDGDEHGGAMRYRQQERDDADGHRAQHGGGAGDQAARVGQRAAEAVGGADGGDADGGRAGAAHDDERRQQQCENGLPQVHAGTMPASGAGGLERLCEPAPGDRIRMMGGAGGIERFEAHLHGQAFAPHRHDTYGIGITLSGVQSFRFRGVQWHCLAGQCHVLHPDEAHDGGAGTEAGFVYRIIHVDPALVQAALGGRALPFVANPVIDAALLDGEMWDFSDAIDELTQTDLVEAVARLLVAASGGAVARGVPALRCVSPVRELLAARPEQRASMQELERVSGLDRWTLARQFRAAFGTSPSRFRTLRQLDLVRVLVGRGVSLASASVEAGFADQSHMTRRFKGAYGMTPGEWMAAVR